MNYLEIGKIMHSRSFDIMVGESFFAEDLTQIQGDFPEVLVGDCPFFKR